MSMADIAVAPSLVEAWEARGGTWRFINSLTDANATSLIRYDEDELVSALNESSGVQAVLGTRDVEVWEAQQVLRRRLPDRLDKLGFCGMFDTPWSRAGSPPFTTISVDIPAMVSAAMEMVDALRAGKTPYDRFVTVPPKVVVRTAR
jgi:DNA-binding LacI/PurR family transcriptional regulator